MKKIFIFFAIFSMCFAFNADAQRRRRGSDSDDRGQASRTKRSGRGNSSSPRTSEEDQDSNTSTGRRGQRSAPTRGGGAAQKRSGRGGSATPSAPTRQTSSPSRGTGARSGRGTPRAPSASPSRGSSTGRSARGMPRAGRSGRGSSRGRSATTTTSRCRRSSTLRSATVPTTAGQSSLPQTAEEAGQQLLAADDCKKRYDECVEQFCAMPDDDYNAGTCLCSDSVLKLRPLEDKLFDQKKRIVQMNALAKSGGVGLKAFSEKIADEMNLDQEDEDDPFKTSFDFDIPSEDIKEPTRGKELYVEAQKACKPFLDMCVSSKNYIQKSFEARMNKDCIIYQNNMRKASEKFNLLAQNLYNKIQKNKDKAANKYDGATCAVEFKSCMIDSAGCGANFENCGSKAILENNRTFCQNILDSCQNSADQVWSAFMTDALQLNKQNKKTRYAQCARDLQICMNEYCADCENKRDLESQKPLCMDRLLPCGDKAESLWKAFVKSQGPVLMRKAREQRQIEERSYVAPTVTPPSSLNTTTTQTPPTVASKIYRKVAYGFPACLPTNPTCKKFITKEFKVGSSIKCALSTFGSSDPSPGMPKMCIVDITKEKYKSNEEFIVR